jgi:hypothetical protein
LIYVNRGTYRDRSKPDEPKLLLCWENSRLFLKLREDSITAPRR